jgi:hypothetical protein
MHVPAAWAAHGILSQTNTDPHPRSLARPEQKRIGCKRLTRTMMNVSVKANTPGQQRKREKGSTGETRAVHAQVASSVCAITHACAHHRLIPNEAVIIPRAVALHLE